MRTTQKRQVCVLLPNKQHLDCTVMVRSRGHEVLDSVLKQLGVSELQVLGLAVLRDNEYLFLDLEQKLSKYFGKTWSRGSLMVPFILFLRVQYYVESGRLIFSSRVQQLYYAELRQTVLRSQSRHQEALFFQLAASALQAEVGDLQPRAEGRDEEEGEERGRRRKHRHYFLPEDYFPSWLIKRRGRDFLLQHCPVLHTELRGVTRSQAVLQFIREAVSLQDGPVTFYRMRQEKREVRSSILLGVTLRGVHVYQEVEGKQCLLYDFSWSDIERLTFQGSRFEITAVGSLCLSKLVYYTPSAFHAKHVLRHLTDSHRLHISTRGAVSYIQQLEDIQATHSYREAYICDTTRLAHRLRSNSLTSSMSDFSVAVETAAAWSKEEEEEEEEEVTAEFELCVDEPEELFVDDPAEVSWLSELSVDGPLMLPSSYWAAVAMEMKQVLRRRADEEVSVD
ncbi:FERM domain-containing protein 6-like isoform X1 [Epinephelus moara]|uniref:FERM domain-containing protein 6-like isoform X1 n=1 Tax=Epinephelus moara TaxID=300413 RepID=UPI00214EFBB3|nr:FERM domain-containing protein 6-like isoform X1 [Epinephelus moara]